MIELIEPKLRFNKTVLEHRKDRINPDSSPVYPMDYDLPFDYCCSNCGYKISIKNVDLEKHSKSNHSNLKIADKKVIENYLIQITLTNLHFLILNAQHANYR